MYVCAGSLAKTKSFRAHKTGEGQVYYENEVSGETVWDLPPDATLADEVEAAQPETLKRRTS